MKAILMSIHSDPLINILNEDKLRELRKKFPKDYRGWIYLYCCKNGKPVFIPWEFEVEPQEDGTLKALTDFEKGNGKVVARFYCDNVDEYIHGINCDRLEQNNYEDFVKDKVCELSCLSEDELYSYASDLAFSSIHITRLEVFDKPKALSEFKTRYYPQFAGMVKNETHYELRPVIRAPQSWQYIEVESSL